MEKKKNNRIFRHIVSGPFIWAPLVGLLFLDVFLEIYHRVCFPLYGLPYVKRGKYIRIDRHKLKYLGPFDKMGCVYCGYANGWLHYASVIAADTERYFCGIKHENSDDYVELEHHKEFVEYCDEEELKRKYFSR